MINDLAQQNLDPHPTRICHNKTVSRSPVCALIINDDEAERLLINEVATERGFKTSIATTDEEISSAFHGGMHYDVVFVDFHKTGLAFLAQLDHKLFKAAVIADGPISDFFMTACVNIPAVVSVHQRPIDIAAIEDILYCVAVGTYNRKKFSSLIALRWD